MKIIAIGNSPSSGSTLLADLLDSTPFSAVGPELNLFAVKYIYGNYDYFKKNIFNCCAISSIYIHRSAIARYALCNYGISENKLIELLDSCSTQEDFFTIFGEHFLALRGKELDGIVFEKTPQNIAFVEKYFEKFNEYFIHIVRNPIEVYKSLLRRKFPKSIALLTWFFEQAKISPFLNHSKLIVIKYEELTEKPFEIISKIIKIITKKEINPNDIEKYYKNNNYRKYHAPRVSSWKVKEIGKIKKSNYSLTLNDLEELASIYNLRISEGYASIFNMKNYTFQEILEKFGYKANFETNIISKVNKIKNFSLDKESKKFLFKKFLKDFSKFEINFSSINSYLNPVVQDS